VTKHWSGQVEKYLVVTTWLLLIKALEL